MSSVRGDDGRWHHSFRQSWLNTADKCAEQARRELVGILPRWESDAANLGTACHSVFEWALDEKRDGGAPPLVDLIEFFDREWEDAKERITHWIQMKPEKGLRDGRKIVKAFYEQVLPEARPVATEWKFSKVFLEDDQRVITLNGTADYVDERWGLCDWKTASREYEAWLYRRYAIQPTVYTWARYAQLAEQDVLYPFTYFVFMKGSGKLQRLTVERGAAHWSHLQEKVVNLAVQIEAELPVWPLGDKDWWCSPKWCPAWSECKGRFLDE